MNQKTHQDELREQKKQLQMYERLHRCCRLLLSPNLQSYAGKKMAATWFQQHGKKKSNHSFGLFQEMLWEQLEAQFVRHYGNDAVRHQFELFGKKGALELYCIQVSTDLIQLMRPLRECGLAAPIKKGDEKEIFLTCMRFQRCRDNPITALWEKRLKRLAVENDDDEFLQKLLNVRKKSALRFSDLKDDPLQEFLLKHWDCSPCDGAGKLIRDEDGKTIPPLCYFTDKALGIYIEILFEKPVNHLAIAKQCQRLGLLKPKQPLVVWVKGKRLKNVNPID